MFGTRQQTSSFEQKRLLYLNGARNLSPQWGKALYVALAHPNPGSSYPGINVELYGWCSTHSQVAAQSLEAFV